MRRAILCIAVLIAAALPLAAQQQYAPLEKGFQPEKVYQFGDIDHINVFNGNLILTLPIGLSYPLDGGLSYNLVLSYNSKAYDLESKPTGVRASPTRRSNAGMGWTFGMGRFEAHDDSENLSFVDLYEAPDGGDHRFTGTRGACTGQLPNDCPTTYTTDGSNLRLRKSSPSIRRVDSPDGSVRQFEKVTGTSKWRLKSISGPLSTDSATIEYFTTPAIAQCPGANSYWKISDSKSRTHYVCFKSYKMDTIDRPMVDRVVLSGAGTKFYQFTYEERLEIPKPPEDTDFSSGWQQQHSAHVLKKLELLDGSAYTFNYNSFAVLNEMVLPTGAKYSYAYGSYMIPSLEFCANNYGLGFGFAGQTAGVMIRKLEPAVFTGQTAVVRTWTYTPELFPDGSDARYNSVRNCTPPTPEDPNRAATHVQLYDEMVVSIKDDTGKIVASHFSVWPGNDFDRLPSDDVSPEGFKRIHYSRPYGRRDASQSRYLSREISACTGAACSEPTTLSCNHTPSPCTPLRSFYVRHEPDDFVVGEFDDPSSVPNRLHSQRTVFRDDAAGCVPDGTGSTCRWIDQEWKDWDDYGHHRRVETSRLFNSSTDMRVEETSWNKAAGTPRTILTADAWILNTYEDVQVRENGVTLKEQACFDTATGFLRAKRTLLGSAPGGTDLIAVFEKGTDGNLAGESYFGGDLSPVSANDARLCDALDGLQSVTPEYKILHTWQNGRMATSQYQGASFKSLDLTIDSRGLVGASRDTAGLATFYSYDASGRLQSVIPPSGVASTGYIYAKATLDGATLTAPAKVTESRSTSTGSVQNEYQYDSFGRLWREKRLVGDAWSLRETLYDSSDRRKSVSTWASLQNVSDEYAFNPPDVTSWTYDALDRPISITGPDGEVTSFAYAGGRTTTRTLRVAMLAGDTNLATTEFYDPQGRLTGVTEAANTGSARTTTYEYDAGGRLIRVKAPGAAGMQERTLTYDLRGLLTSERHPELGAAGYGTVTYGEYDSRGHAHRKTTGSFDIRMTFDPAERVTQVDDVAASRALKLFDYDDPQGQLYGQCSSQRCNGRLAAAGRYNYDPVLGTIAVTESYHYDAAGRVGRRDRSVGSSGSFVGTDFYFVQTYNDLSEIQSLTYPCAPGNCQLIGPSRTVSHGYRNGRLSVVDDFAPSITYHPNGMLQTVTHGLGSNQVFETWTADAHGLSRPKKIAVRTGANTELWTSGDYEYDGAGNIKTMGPASYRYDAYHRLVSSKVTGGVGSFSTTMYGFDEFGNRLYSSTDPCGTFPDGLVHCASPIFLPRAIDGTTNHYADTSYDGAGNVVEDRGRLFSYDPLGMMTRAQVDSRDFHYLYSADDERVAVVERRNGANKTTWTARDFGNRVLRMWTDDWTSGARTLAWKEDTIWRGNALLANLSPSGTKHYALDHLGSPRLVTSTTGSVLGLQSFSDYGQGGTIDAGALQFTGHERDMANVGGGSVDLPDYFHARFYDFAVGRFLSVDPVLDMKQALRFPQVWNRYTYVRNNPMRYTDPTGKYTCSGTKDECKAFEAGLSILRAAAAEASRNRQAGATQLNAVVNNYGKFGEKTGVAVVFGATTSGNPMETNPKGKATTVTVDRATFAKDLRNRAYVTIASEAAHEGAHTLLTHEEWQTTSRAELMRQEASAYRLQAMMHRSLGIDDNGWLMWFQATGFDTAMINYNASQSVAAICATAPCTP